MQFSRHGELNAIVLILASLTFEGGNMDTNLFRIARLGRFTNVVLHVLQSRTYVFQLGKDKAAIAHFFDGVGQQNHQALLNAKQAFPAFMFGLN